MAESSYSHRARKTNICFLFRTSLINRIWADYSRILVDIQPPLRSLLFSQNPETNGWSHLPERSSFQEKCKSTKYECGEYSSPHYHNFWGSIMWGHPMSITARISSKGSFFFMLKRQNFHSNTRTATWVLTLLGQPTDIHSFAAETVVHGPSEL